MPTSPDDVAVRVYLFRAEGIAAGPVTVCVAAREAVISVFGGGGVKGADGLIDTFNGAAIYRNDLTWDYYFGVWGVRETSRFRRLLREGGLTLDVVRMPPPARLAWTSRSGKKART